MVDRDTQAQPRYRMLETVRQYAEERLNESGESDEIRTRHSLTASRSPSGPRRSRSALRRTRGTRALPQEQENLLAAHAWCEHAPDGGESALRLIALTWRYWSSSAQPERGYRLAEGGARSGWRRPGQRGPVPDAIRARHVHLSPGTLRRDEGLRGAMPGDGAADRRRRADSRRLDQARDRPRTRPAMRRARSSDTIGRWRSPGRWVTSNGSPTS